MENMISQVMANQSIDLSMLLKGIPSSDQSMASFQSLLEQLGNMELIDGEMLDDLGSLPLADLSSMATVFNPTLPLQNAENNVEMTAYASTGAEINAVKEESSANIPHAITNEPIKQTAKEPVDPKLEPDEQVKRKNWVPTTKYPEKIEGAVQGKSQPFKVDSGVVSKEKIQLMDEAPKIKPLEGRETLPNLEPKTTGIESKDMRPIDKELMDRGELRNRMFLGLNEMKQYSSSEARQHSPTGVKLQRNPVQTEVAAKQNEVNTKEQVQKSLTFNIPKQGKETMISDVKVQKNPFEALDKTQPVKITKAKIEGETPQYQVIADDAALKIDQKVTPSVKVPEQIVNVQEVRQTIETAVLKGQEKLSVKLKPEVLGGLVIEAVKGENGTRINIIADTIEGLEALKGKLPEIESVIKESGSSYEGLDLSYNSDQGAAYKNEQQMPRFKRMVNQRPLPESMSIESMASGTIYNAQGQISILA